MRISCPKCTIINNVIDLSKINNCYLCGQLIYKPDDILVSQIKSADERERKISDNYLKAYEEIPQVFIPAKMIHITGKINNHKIKFLVDTGAQVSLLPLNFVTACGLQDLIDNKYHGELKGVGTDKIVGKLHYVEITFPIGVFPGSFTVCKNNSIEAILGIDMMQALGITIDFKKRSLLFGVHSLPFE